MNPEIESVFNEITKDIEDGKWVVLSTDRKSVFCEGYTCGDVMAQAKEKGQPNPTAYRIMRTGKKARERFGFLR